MKLQIETWRSYLNEKKSEYSNQHKDIIPGGRGRGKEPKAFNQKELRMGIKVEMEHTEDRDMAEEIAMDHLTEFPDYYTRLKKMEEAP
jgi:hypothetical protein